MRRIKAILRMSFFLTLGALVLSSCLKTKDPYADYTPEREAKLIKGWYDEMTTVKKFNVQSTPSGIYYIMQTQGTGPTIVAGNKLTVSYTGMFMDGKIFDSSKEFAYTHKTERMVAGWEEGIELMSKGAKAVFLIPSSKAYGPTGYMSIPPNTPLLFSIEILDIN